jgi:DNA mismatch endonuclease (patch repair protein)
MGWKLEEGSPDLLNGIQRPGSGLRVPGHAARLGEGCDVNLRRAAILQPYSHSAQGARSTFLTYDLTPPSDVVRRQMQAQKSSGTRMELQLRRSLYALGYRYRVNCRLLPDHRFKGDIVWRGRRLVVFLDGCFWHGCPIHGTTPKSNTEWWRQKIKSNQDRDRRVNEILRQSGWTVLRFWEHDDSEKIIESVVQELEAIDSARKMLR